jgi:endo-1,4-beta-xylanase
MVSSKSLLLAAAGALALPFTSTDGRGGSVSELLTSRAGTPSSEGEHGGFFYSFWTDGGGTVNYENKDDGSYAVSWQNCSNFVGGKGWSPGTPRTINYESDFSTTGNGYLAIYGHDQQETQPIATYIALINK